jgi:hypothetical protein
MIKTIPSYPTYGCDELGNVYDMTGAQPKILKTYNIGGNPIKGRYHGVYISNGGKRVGIKYVHRLVAETWLEGWNPDHQVDHINRVRTDNRAENLRGLTRQQNLVNNAAKGVSYNKKTKLWSAYIQLNGKTKQFYCKTEAEAIKKREELVRIHYPTHALNQMA